MMKPANNLLRSFLVFSLAFSMLPTLTFAQHYTQTNLVSNISGSASVTDPNLQNAWGLVASPTSPWWVSNNAGGTSTLYDASGLTLSPPSVPPVAVVPINGNGIVTIPSAPSQNGAPGSPTGIMFNGNPADFHLPNGNRARFIFVTEDGTVKGGAAGPRGGLVADNSLTPGPTNEPGSKGGTPSETNGKEEFLAATFRRGRI